MVDNLKGENMELRVFIDNLSDIQMMTGQFEKLTNTVVSIECSEADVGMYYTLRIEDANTDAFLLSKSFCDLDEIYSYVETMLTIAKVIKRA